MTITTTAPALDTLPLREGFCQCYHEEQTDGTHHFLDLPSQEQLDMKESYHREITSNPVYIETSYAQGEYCFLRPQWLCLIGGEGTYGQVPPTPVKLCPWCKDHWRESPQFSAQELRD